MSFPDFLSKFQIDKWYKLTAAVSAVVLVVSLFYKTEVLDNRYIISISTGVLLYSLVEWNQFKKRMGLEGSFMMGFLKYTWQEKVWTIWDVILKTIAVLLVGLPVLSIVFGIHLMYF